MAEIKKYTVSKWLKIFCLLSVLLIGLLFYFNKDEYWTGLFLALLLIFSLVAFVSTFSDSLTLKKTELVVIQNLKKTVIPKGDIKEVSWAKGCPVTLILNNNHKIDLPELDVFPLQLRNTVMKWNNS